MKQQPSNVPPGNAAGAEGARRPAREPAVRAGVVVNDDDALSVLESLAGSIIAPADWATEHDHYLYGTPKRSADPA